MGPSGTSPQLRVIPSEVGGTSKGVVGFTGDLACGVLRRFTSNGCPATQLGTAACGESSARREIHGGHAVCLSRRGRPSLVSHQTHSARSRDGSGPPGRGGAAGGGTRSARQGAVVLCHRASTGAELAGSCRR